MSTQSEGEDGPLQGPGGQQDEALPLPPQLSLRETLVADMGIVNSTLDVMPRRAYRSPGVLITPLKM